MGPMVPGIPASFATPEFKLADVNDELMVVVNCLSEIRVVLTTGYDVDVEKALVRVGEAFCAIARCIGSVHLEQRRNYQAVRAAAGK